MAIPNLKSKQQLLGGMFRSILSKLDLNDSNRGSFIRTALEAVAAEQFQQYVELVKILKSINLNDRKKGDLDLTGEELDLPRILAAKATGPISILRPASFTKVSSTFYSGLPAAVSGDTEVRVNDASDILFGTSGTLIIGRGTVNEEEVTYSTAPVNNTNYWTFTTSVIVNNHGREETVILKQGVDETISSGETITIPASGSSAALNFTVDQDTVLLSGEDRVENVTITASEKGAKGNIPIGAIDGADAFPNPPFTGARAENNTKFSTGFDRESDDAYRDRLKQRIQSLSKGTQTAILNAIIGLVDSATAKRVVSANVILPASLDDWVRIYIDDGTGFEPDFDYIGGEVLLQAANGGEERLKVNLVPTVKAFAETNISEPYNISGLGNSSLTVQVGLDQETIPFNIGSFSFPEAATAEEVAKNINDNSITLEARTANGGKDVVIQAKSDTNENVKVIAGGVNGLLGFPVDERVTIYVYKNDILLSKDGSTAFQDTDNQPFNFAGPGPWVLNVVVDGKTANSQTVTFVSGDFATPSAATASEVKTVIDAQLVGVETLLINNNNSVRLVSLTKLSQKSKIQITGGTAQPVLNISTSEVVGSDKDYLFNPQTGIIEFASPLVKDDQISIGSNFTRGALRSGSSEPYLFAAPETMILLVEGVAQPQTTIPAGTYSAQQIADIINAGTEGVKASSRAVGSLNFLEVSTNTFEEGVGTIKVDAVDNAAAITLGLTVNSVQTSLRPHKAFVVSGNAGDYSFFEGDNLVVTMDNDPATKTFTVTMDRDGAVTGVVSPTVFSDSSFINIFKNVDEIKDFRLLSTAGANQMALDIADISNTAGNTWRFTFDSIPANFNDFAIGDVFVASGITASGNNGAFLITGKDNTPASEHIEVTNLSGAAELNSSGTAQAQALRVVDSYNQTTGQITLVSGLPQAPTITDTFVVIPVSVTNMEAYFNNLRITTISSKAEVLSVEGNTKLQISSISDGSDGYVQVTGGSANSQFAFDTSIFRGLQGYAKYTGLLEAVHKAVYGDDQDFVANEGVGAAGIRFEIKAPTKEEISFDLDVTLKEGLSISSVEDDIKSAITGYVNDLGIGDSVILAEITERVMAISGIIDVEILSPTSNQIIQENELARTNDALITAG